MRALDICVKTADAQGLAKSTGLACPDISANVDTVERALREHHRHHGLGRWDDQPGHGQARAARQALNDARMLTCWPPRWTGRARQRCRSWRMRVRAATSLANQ